jgi:DNA excision repair protein ERCC-5
VTKLFLPPPFPDSRIDEAYLNPEVDKDPSAFEWGVPDLAGLRDFLMATVGWSQDRTDEVLVPVIRDMNQKQAEGTQSNITHFFEGSTGAGVFAPRKKVENKSKRMEKAMLSLHEQALGKRKGTEQDGHEVEEELQEPKPKRVKKAKPGAKRKARASPVADEDDGYRDEDAVPVKRRKKSVRKSAPKN